MPFCNHRLNILSWNIQGLKHSLYDKTKDPLFQNEISNCQIVALTETHMTEDEDINIPGFRLLTKGCRNKKSDKGGTAIFIRHDLKKYVQVVGKKTLTFCGVFFQKNILGSIRTYLFVVATPVLETQNG